MDIEQGVMVHTYNPSTQEAEAGELWIEGWHELHSKILALNKPRRREIDFQNYFQPKKKKWLAPLGLPTHFKCWPGPTSGCGFCTGEHLSPLGSICSLFVLWLISGSGAGMLLCGRMVFSY
jgi:hypothetical protein